jgi:hypothetical protein
MYNTHTEREQYYRSILGTLVCKFRPQSCISVQDRLLLIKKAYIVDSDIKIFIFVHTTKVIELTE